jgi:hypothetical protein
MKNNIDYYQHYANADQHPKFKMLRVSHGWAGEGRFWALNNRIAQADNCCLDISKKYNAASIASDLGLTFQEFQEFIECLKNDCELIRECEPGVITTDIIQENFQSVSANREKARERKKRYLEKVSKGSPELSNGSPEQNNKVKERKVKETIPPLPPRGKIDELKDYLLKNIPKDMQPHVLKITEFYKYRQQKPKADRYKTEKGINGLFRDLSNCKAAGYDIDACMEIAMERNWKTPSVDYFKPELFRSMGLDKKPSWQKAH